VQEKRLAGLARKINQIKGGLASERDGAQDRVTWNSGRGGAKKKARSNFLVRWASCHSDFPHCQRDMRSGFGVRGSGSGDRDWKSSRSRTPIPESRTAAISSLERASRDLWAQIPGPRHLDIDLRGSTGGRYARVPVLQSTEVRKGDVPPSEF